MAGRSLAQLSLLSLLLCALAAVAAAGGGAAAADAAAATEQHSMPELDLDKATIQPKLAALPASDHVLLEFFASWCPACRAFRPEFEKAAAFLLAASKVHVFRMDCAAHPDVCDTYKVTGYPTMYAGPAGDAAAAAVDKLTKFEYGKFSRDARGTVQFVAAALKLNLEYSEATAKSAAAAATAGAGSAGASNKTAAPPAAKAAAATWAAATPAEWTAADVEAATRQLFASITASHPNQGLPQRRAALLLLLKFWAAGHPLPTCRAGSAALLQQLPALWPAGAAVDPWRTATGGSNGTGSSTAAVPAVAGRPPTDVCGGAGSSGGPSWVACAGSTPDSRGFTCGLWLLFHTASVRLPEADGGSLLVAALRGFAEYFFQCEVCRRHFVELTSAPEAAAVRSRRDGVLWLWRAHNQVNERLRQVESKYGHSSTGDPALRKQQWPGVAECAQCRLPLLPSERAGSGEGGSSEPPLVKWNEDEVYRFLVKHYGRQPGSSTAASSRLAAAGAVPGLYPDGQASFTGASAGGPPGGAGGGLFGLASSRGGALALLVLAVLAFVVLRSQGLVGGGHGGKAGRRHHVKGPGMFGGGGRGGIMGAGPRGAVVGAGLLNGSRLK